MSKWIPEAKKKSDLYSQTDFNPFDCIEQQKPKLFIENVERHNVREFGSRAKVLMDVFSCPSIKIPSYFAVTKRIGISTQAVVSDSMEACLCFELVRDEHLSPAKGVLDLAQPNRALYKELSSCRKADSCANTQRSRPYVYMMHELIKRVHLTLLIRIKAAITGGLYIHSG